ncbi:MATE family efflux transporter [Pelotomaculum terephthalicicum JT]|uniref:MATE family efflux transporter n=1 Tax=Pelotomaculum TaxID=191373 RepID=UPI0009CF3CA3|nr:MULTISPECIES: MATE family efflux transporter [Pelotomaculum]MCG9968700.1 MATE family efflux transporter [Pelotomaculum terephthalicicum JT]OPX86987.1 MAG: Multidrug export protein MepA [Pelotomaculum sp. PtaB.Bin117]
MQNSLEMRDKKISVLLWKFSLPAIAGMLINALYNIIDRIFVGRGVGSLAIAATTVAFPIMLILIAVSILIGIGATALISIRLGEQRKEEAEKIAGNAAVMLIALPLIIAVIYLLFPEPILKAFGASEEVLPYARDFVHIIILGAAFGSISMGMNNFIRAEGNPRLAMFTQVAGALINGVLNYVFIFKLGLGIKGSALATVSGQFISSVWVLSYFWSGRSLVKIRFKNLKLQLPIITSIVSIGFAPFAMQIANSVQQSILNKTLLAYGGDLALSAVGIMMSIAALLFMPIVGLSQGAQPLIGFNYGARQYDRVKETVKIAVIAGVCIASAGFVAINIWPTQIVGLFSEGDTALTEMTAQAMRMFFALFPVVGFQIICANYFQAAGKPVQSAILSLSRQVLLFIPLLLILPKFWGINGVWRTAPIADGISVLVTAIFIFFEMKNLPKKQTTNCTS